MSESFVDITYRGLSLARRAKLAEVRPSSGYVEVPQPMPVGTAIAIITDDTVAFDATVVSVREQTTGSEIPAGMVVRPKLEGDAAQRWWKARVTLAEPEAAPRLADLAAQPPVVVVSRRMTNAGMGVPNVVEEHDTGVMDAIDPAVIEAAAEPAASESLSKLVDDGKKTTAMAVVDLEALGLATDGSSGDGSNGGGGEDDGGPDPGGTDPGDAAKSDSKSSSRKKRRRR